MRLIALDAKHPEEKDKRRHWCKHGQQDVNVFSQKLWYNYFCQLWSLGWECMCVCVCVCVCGPYGIMGIKRESYERANSGQNGTNWYQIRNSSFFFFFFFCRFFLNKPRGAWQAERTLDQRAAEREGTWEQKRKMLGGGIQINVWQERGWARWKLIRRESVCACCFSWMNLDSLLTLTKIAAGRLLVLISVCVLVRRQQSEKQMESGDRTDILLPFIDLSGRETNWDGTTLTRQRDTELANNY